MMKSIGPLAVLCCLLVQCVSIQTLAQDGSTWGQIVRADQPVARWTFSGREPFRISTSAKTTSLGQTIAPSSTSSVVVDANSPRLLSPFFSAENTTALFNGRNSVLKYSDPGENSIFDFDRGDGMTIEAWVSPKKLPTGFRHIISKGRTKNKGFPADNQNWALRLTNVKGQAGLSFLFANREDKPGTFHRWTSSRGFRVDGKWHHVAITFEFGKADSMRGYVDGKQTMGTWDLNGKTNKAPIADNDEIWVGSAMGVNPSSTFDGRLDEIALYRKALPAQRFFERVPFIERPDAPPLPQDRPPRDRVLVEVLEDVPDTLGWHLDDNHRSSESYTEPAFAFFEIPPRYSDKGLRIDRSNPLVLRASSIVQFPAGQHKLLLRTLRYGRLYIDDQLVVETPVRGHRPNAHGAMYELESKIAPGTRNLYPGAAEKLAEFEFDGNEHELRLEIHVGGQKRRPELGETLLAVAKGNQPFKVLSSTLDIPLTDTGWESYERTRREQYLAINQQRRQRAISASQRLYWQKRHQYAKTLVDPKSQVWPVTITQGWVNNKVDAFLISQLEKGKFIAPSAVVDDWTFLRRASLDVIGTPPPDDLLERFQRTKHSRREWLVDQLLEHPGWADNWVSYWQDVLAENPNVVNPTLNNTGPFRWWIYESFLDNKPFDQFATELIMMEGSAYFGGPAGFSMATENDVPFAAKAHIVGQALMAFEMQCARCHDAPYHDFKQSDLFSLAAMLGRKSQSVPKSSSLPGGKSNSELVTVTLAPGASVPAKWPFEEKIDSKFPPFFIRDSNDSREELAARITSPHNPRFARVIVNRLWARYLGRGLVAKVDDWETEKPSYPKVLDYLADELVHSGYNLKHVARLILTSQAYQRQVAQNEGASPQQFLTAVRRRLSAEQLVDTVFAISGKQFRAGDMNIDVDGSRALTSSLNLGIPRRAWMFSSTSNERDRPGLALPLAQPFIAVLETFGWRGSRQNPVNTREAEATALQPAIIANGALGRRFSRLSDDSYFTRLAIKADSATDLVTKTFLRVLTRPPSSEERAIFVELLSEGFAQRVVDPNAPDVAPIPTRTGVGWSNHLDPEANTTQIRFQRAVYRGDPPTNKLAPKWREQYEDMLWSLLNSPEFIFVP